MNYYSDNKKRKKRRRNQRRGLYTLIGVLSVVLLALVLVLLLGQPKVTLYSELTMEAGGAFPAPQSFLAEKRDVQIAYAKTSAVKPNVPGVYDVMLTANGKEYASKIRVVDTVAPMATLQDINSMGRIPEAEDFVVSVTDATEVTATYLTEPDKNKDGEQTVTIVLTDAGGNTTQLQTKLTLVIDREAPVITGATDKIVYLGESVSYMSGITVTDDMDPEPTVEVDRSAVDLTTIGEYPITYTATDASGNTAVVSCTLKVLEKKDYYVPYETIYQEVDSILADIIEDDMTMQEQVWAIYVWIRTNNTYVNHSDKEDWMQAAHVMMTENKGDCFNYYALCRLMLDRLEIPNMDVRKVKNYEGDSDHYWSLVSLDGGNTWYHVDTTPRTNPASFCMVTDKFMDEYSAANGNCFNRDKSLYPATPEDEL
ncbi:MAG: transglutaminase domain-containing protein [Oscillospiraceae bacterium]|nr:transglutaminase domain-containing protein [Oscillospiraceae bacterium]